MSATEESTAGGGETHITFNVKSSNDQKFTITVPESMTVLALKEKLSASEYADTPPERQRLIYSGRVMKDPDAISVYKIKDGNTIHMVKSAASTQRQTTTAASQGSSGTSGTTTNPSQSNPSAAGVPQNIAAGTGNDPLSGLTGARYAGFAQMPGASMFGADGGMGAPPDPDEMLRMLENPMFQAQMNEAMNNPAVIQMMQNSPGIRDQPFIRDMLNNPEMRRMMMDPSFIRASMQMNRMFGGRGSPGGAGAQGMPAPGVTDTTPQGGNENNTSGNNTSTDSSRPPNPFAMFPPMGGGGAGAGAGAGANPLAALFGQFPPPNNSSNTSRDNTTTTASSEANPSQTSSQAPSGEDQGGQTRPEDAQNQSSQSPPPPSNPLAGLFGNMGSLGAQGGDQQQQQQQQGNPFAMAQQMLQNNPDMMRMMMDSFANPNAAGQAGQGDQQAASSGGAGAGAGFNPFSMFGAGGFGAPQPPADNRPPEEQFAGELRQLNDMGFHDFERNVRALRMAGGSVQGAIEYLLNGS